MTRQHCLQGPLPEAEERSDGRGGGGQEEEEEESQNGEFAGG